MIKTPLYHNYNLNFQPARPETYSRPFSCSKDMIDKIKPGVTVVLVKEDENLFFPMSFMLTVDDMTLEDGAYILSGTAYDISKESKFGVQTMSLKNLNIGGKFKVYRPQTTINPILNTITVMDDDISMSVRDKINKIQRIYSTSATALMDMSKEIQEQLNFNITNDGHI